MTALGTPLGRALLALALLTSAPGAPAHAQGANSGPLDPYAPPAPPAPPGVAPSNSGNSSTINNTANPSNSVAANPTQTNTSTNDNRSNAAVTNNNTIYIYPPSLPPPPPPVIAPPLILPPVLPPPTTSLSPPPLIPPPPYARSPYVRGPYAYPPRPYVRAQRIRLNCGPYCAPAPSPLPPVLNRERVRYVSLGAQVTAFGMAHQPLAGWGTLYGGGIHLTVRSSGRFGFEMSQDFLRGELRASDQGQAIVRTSFPFQLTLKGYILPNSDRHHFNLYFGGGVGAMPSSIEVALGNGVVGQQNFLEWMVHGDIGAELRWSWFALGADARISAVVRDHYYGDGAQYGDVQDGPVPAKTWGVQGRGYLNFWF